MYGIFVNLENSSKHHILLSYGNPSVSIYNTTHHIDVNTMQSVLSVDHDICIKIIKIKRRNK